MAGDRDFWNGIAAKYAARPVGDEEAYQRKLRETQALLRPDMRLLELGCGTGSTALAHAPYVREVHAVDISDRMLDIGRRAADAKGIENLRFERAPVAGFTPEAASYDMVLMLSLLHLLDDPASALRMADRALKPGGCLVTSTMCMGDHLRMVKPLIAVMRWFGKAPGTVRFFRQAELVGMMEDAGFAIETCWRPGKRAASFVIARKPALASGAD